MTIWCGNVKSGFARLIAGLCLGMGSLLAPATAEASPFVTCGIDEDRCCNYCFMNDCDLPSTSPDPSCHFGSSLVSVEPVDSVCAAQGISNPQEYCAAQIPKYPMGVCVSNVDPATPELPNGQDDNCDGVGLGDEFCDGIDNDGDGKIDEDAGSCLLRLLFVPYCMQATTTQDAAQSKVTDWVDVFEDKFLIASCGHLSTRKKIYSKVAPLGTVACPTVTSTAELLALPAVAALKPEEYDAVAFFRDTITDDCVGGLSSSGMLISLAGEDGFNGRYITFAHEMGHKFGLGEEYRDDTTAPNRVRAELGCDVSTCCVYSHPACDFLQGNMCLGNEAVDTDALKWVYDPALNANVLKTFGGTDPSYATHGDGSRCVMSWASAPGWDIADDTVTGEGSHRTFCKACLQHLAPKNLTCHTNFNGSRLMVSASGEMKPDGKIVIIRSVTGEGRVPDVEMPQNGPIRVEVTDANGQLLTSFTPETAQSDPGEPVSIQSFWIREPIDEDVADQPITLRSFDGDEPLSQTTLQGEPPGVVAPDVTVECTSPTGANVALDASGSSDPDGDTLTFAWTAPAGITLTNADEAVAQGKFPIGTKTASVSVSDGSSPAVTDAVTVKVQDTKPPVFDAASLAEAVRSACGETGPVTLPLPTAHDTCSTTVTVTGAVVTSSVAGITLPRALTGNGVTLPAGTFTVRWTATDAAGLTATRDQQLRVLPTLLGTASAVAADRANLQSGTSYAAMYNFGTTLTRVGVNAHTGTVISKGAIDLRNGATVHGNARSGGSIAGLNVATVTGTAQQNQTLAFPTLPWPTFGNAGTTNFTVAPNTSPPAIAPGRYNNVIVNGGGTLTLQAGAYTIASLTVESNATVKRLGDVAIGVKNTMIARGSFTGTGVLTLGYAGTTQAVLGPALNARVFAQNAELAVRGTVSGSLWAKSLLIDADSRFSCIASSDASPAPTQPLSREVEEPSFLGEADSASAPAAAAAASEPSAAIDAEPADGSEGSGGLSCSVGTGKARGGAGILAGMLLLGCIALGRRRRSA